MNASDLKGKIDFGIITVREDEFRAVLLRFPAGYDAEGQRTYYINKTANDYLIAVVRCVEPGGAEGADVARDLIEDLDPQWLVLVGIAGAVPASEFTLGDVVVATRLHDFSVGAAIEGKQPEYAGFGGPMHKAVQNLLAYLPALEEKLAGWNSPSNIGATRPRVDMRPESLYGSDDWKEKSKK